MRIQFLAKHINASMFIEDWPRWHQYKVTLFNIEINDYKFVSRGLAKVASIQSHII